MPDQNYNLFELIRILSKWKKTIIYVTLSAAICSAIVSLLLPDYYKSTTIFYPYNLKNYDPRKLDLPSEEIFGSREDCDRLFLIGRSSALENTLVKKFDLIKRYDIDTTRKYVQTRVIRELVDNLTIVKNERGAIEISVYDKDPKFAAAMANEAVNLIGQIYIGPVKENNMKLLKVLKTEVDNKYQELDTLSRSVSILKNGAQYKNASAYFDDIKNVDVRVTDLMLEALQAKEKYMRAMEYYKTEPPSVFIMESAGVSEKKSKPIRWIIVLSTTFGAFVLISLAVILIELYNKSKAQQ